MFGQCDYATEDWYCVKQEGHSGPHESVSLAPVHSRPECICPPDYTDSRCPNCTPAKSRGRES